MHNNTTYVMNTMILLNVYLLGAIVILSTSSSSFNVGIVAAYTPPSSLFGGIGSSSKLKSKSASSTSSSSSLVIRHVVQSSSTSTSSSSTVYTPKWVKKKTLAEEKGSIKDLGFEQVGLKGTIPVVFRQGNETRTSMAWAGQPIREVAIQAGQFIQYGCGKGECGTCECNMNGKWVRPCIETIPASAGAAGAGDLIIQVKEVKSKVVSSGKFFSIRSFLFGFWNNLLGMIGFVQFRRAAKANREERRNYETLVAQRTLEKKLARAQAAAAAAATQAGGTNNQSPGMA
jgi:ferredoxin